MNNSLSLLCVSLNPAIDRRIRVPRLEIGEVNRASSISPSAGGKAAHVAFAATALGAKVRWLAFLGGPEGESCRSGMQERGVTPIVVPIAGRTRTNLELIDEASGEITEVLEPGPMISESEIAKFLRQFEQEISECSLVVLSGSSPPGVPNSFYAELVMLAKKAGCRVLMDASGAPLAEALSSLPDMIKPNRQEAGALLGKSIRSVGEAVAAARELRHLGAQTVVVSLGADGAVAVDEHALHGSAPHLDALSTVGSGDSFLAGWGVGMAQRFSSEECLRLAIACGTANCIADSPGVISAEAVERLFKEVSVRAVAE